MPSVVNNQGPTRSTLGAARPTEDPSTTSEQPVAGTSKHTRFDADVNTLTASEVHVRTPASASLLQGPVNSRQLARNQAAVTTAALRGNAPRVLASEQEGTGVANLATLEGAQPAAAGDAAA